MRFVIRKISLQAERVLRIIVALMAGTIAPRLYSATTDPAPTFTQTNLVADVAGMAKITDPNLVNPWGMALGINSGSVGFQ